MTEAWRSLGAYAHALVVSWWTVAFAVTSGWGVIVFLEPQLALVLPPQVTWGAALFCWIAAPFRAYHRMRLEAARPRPESDVRLPSNFAVNSPGAASPNTGTGNQYNISAQSVTIHHGVPTVEASQAPALVTQAHAAPAPLPAPEPPQVAPADAVPPAPLEAGVDPENEEPHAENEPEEGQGGGGQIVLEEEPEPDQEPPL